MTEETKPIDNPKFRIKANRTVSEEEARRRLAMAYRLILEAAEQPEKKPE